MSRSNDGYPSRPSPPFELRPLVLHEEPARESMPLPPIRVLHEEVSRASLPGSSAQHSRQTMETSRLGTPAQVGSSSDTAPAPTQGAWTALNQQQSNKSASKKAKTQPAADRPLAPLAPAPPRQLQRPAPPRQIAIQPRPPDTVGKSFYSLPAEIRVEIYNLVLESVTLHILPREAGRERRAPHALTRTSKIVRNEVLPIIHSSCAIVAVINDFDFSSILEFMARIPPNEHKALMKNNRLKIQLCTTGEKSKGAQQAVRDAGSLRKWLSYRADPYRPQPKWEYCGVWPGRKVESDIRRRIKRMPEEGKKQEMIKLATSIGLQRLQPSPTPG